MPHYKILVIDYEPRGVAQLRDPLHAAGYLVSVAHDGVSGMQLFDEIRPDLTLVEAMLPRKHGFEVCGEMKKTPHGARSPVVIVTSVYRGRKYRTQAFHNYHCDEFLEKPISSTTLLSTVERLLKDRPLAADPAEAARVVLTSPAEPEFEAMQEPEIEVIQEAKPKVEPKPKVEAKPAAKPAPKPKAAAAAPAPVEDDAELEISEALDDLFGGGSDSGPQASASSAPDGENILSFDLSRGRSAPAVSDAQIIPGGPQAGPSGVGPSTAGSAQAARALQPTRDQRPTVAPKTWPELRDRDSRPGPTRRRRAGRGRLLLLLTILVVAAASSAAFLILNWPF
jgi:CheY-like chemotaxis protein